MPRKKLKQRKRKVHVGKNNNAIVKVNGKWCRVLDCTQVYDVPGRHGMSWEHMGEGLVRHAPYSPEGMAIIAKLGGVKGFIRHTMPMLPPERQRILAERFSSISHAKQRLFDKQNSDANRARRLTRKEKRTLKATTSTLKRLKALLKS